MLITGESANLRVGPSTEFGIADVLHAGGMLTLVNIERWAPVLVNGEVRCVSAKYAKLAD